MEEKPQQRHGFTTKQKENLKAWQDTHHEAHRTWQYFNMLDNQQVEAK